MTLGAAALLVLQIVTYSSPPSGDTVGYWQQRVQYTMAATLDEEAQLVRARGTLRYVNASPDTLHELYFFQYLNAFRPASRWSAADEREGRERFQRLPDPHYGFERIRAYDWPAGVSRETRGPGVLVAAGDGSDETLVQVQYPFAPDSTVAHVPLPVRLPPGDSLIVSLEWEARPSTVFRRQGRRGRQWDLAQWYPKVAVYDRRGWAVTPFIPQGELYGELGSYDVTLVVRQDQILGATGVPVSGDPGWERVRRWGAVHGVDAAGDAPAPDDSLEVPAGHRAVRFLASDVHHFAWTAYPQYRYEGALHDGRVAIHVLYRPGDESTWGSGTVVERATRALEWLEWLYGPYQYPQITLTHRLDVGATEFPMIVMNSSPSQGLILHEVGHSYTYGMLANNEWRAGWMDEGMTEYQTAWAQNLTLPEMAHGLGPPPPERPSGYAGRAITPAPRERTTIERYRRVMSGRAQPIGTVAAEFDEFALYQGAVYTSAEAMLGALRDAMGDSAFVRFHRLYFARWKLKHVDEPALRRAAEDACACELDWFFDQWVHRTGLLDYRLGRVDVRRAGSEWVTRARIEREGTYTHPMPLGVRTASGWTLARARQAPWEQWVEVRTVERPLEVRLDPMGVTDDWDRRNDVKSRFWLTDERVIRHALDWPFLEQWERGRTVAAWTPMLWYGDPGGAVVGARVRTSYMGLVDRLELGLAMATRTAPGGHALGRIQLWTTLESPALASRALLGLELGVAALDGVGRIEVRQRWDVSPFVVARGPRRSVTLAVARTDPYELAWVDRARWTPARVLDARLGAQVVSAEGDAGLGGELLGGHAEGREEGVSSGAFVRAMAEAWRTFALGTDGRTRLRGRVFGALASGRTPLQRSIGLSSLDPTETFREHLLRAPGAPLVRRDVGYVALGHAELRGYSLFARTDAIAAGNVELSRLVRRGTSTLPGLWVTLFGDAGATDGDVVWDAGVGLAFRGSLFDSDVDVQLNLPLYVSHGQLAATRNDDEESFGLRWSFSIRR